MKVLCFLGGLVGGLFVIGLLAAGGYHIVFLDGAEGYIPALTAGIAALVLAALATIMTMVGTWKPPSREWWWVAIGVPFGVALFIAAQLLHGIW